MINRPASFTLRTLATVTEHSYMLLITMTFVLLSVSQPTLRDAVFFIFLYLILFLLNPLVHFQSILLTHYFGGSLGKLLTGLQVVSEQETRLSFKRIVFRQSIGYSFSSLVFGLGFLAIIKDARKQGWHDKTVGSLVIVNQNLWPLAAVFCVAALAGTVYMGTLSWEKVTYGPLKAEAQTIIQSYQESIPKQDEPEVVPQMKSSPTFFPLAPTPTPLPV